MMAALTLIDRPLLVDGENDQAWSWQSDDPGCPHLGPYAPQPVGITPPQSERPSDVR